jgi:hypothetical protein
MTHQLTQHDLNEMLMGPEMPIEARHAETLLIVFVTFTYSASIPILYWIAALNILFQYICDHIGFLRFYRTPPMLSANLARACSYCYPFAIVIHAFMVLWVFGADGILQKDAVSTTGIEQKLEGTKTLSTLIQDRAFGTTTSAYFWALFAVLLTTYLVLKMTFIEQMERIWNIIRRKPPSWEHNPDYYNALPAHVLESIIEDPEHWRAEGLVGNLTLEQIKHRAESVVEIRRQHYQKIAKAKHEGRKKKVRKLRRAREAQVMVGLHCYDMCVNPRYSYVMTEDQDTLKELATRERKDTLTELEGMKEHGLDDTMKKEVFDLQALIAGNRYYTLVSPPPHPPPFLFLS